MKIRHKLFGSAALYLTLYLCAILPYSAMRWLADAVHDLLVELFPDTFHSYNVITTPDEYLVQSARLDAVTVAVVILLITYAALRLDNKRFESFIVANEGLYTMPEGLTQYARKFLLCDLIISLTVPALFTLPVVFISEPWLERGVWIVSALNHTVAGASGTVNATLLCMLFSICARFVAIPLTVARWRASWLCGSIE